MMPAMNRCLLVAGLLLGAVAAHAASRVIAVRNPQPADIRATVAAGLKALAGPRDEATAWRAFVSTNDVVGIKINTQAAPLLATHRAVVDALVAGLCSAGVPSENIRVFDRDIEKMREAGFAGPRVSGVVWDPETFYESKLVGRLIWGDLLFRPNDEQISTRSHLPKLVTRTITKLINVPVLQSHDACGLCGSLYNVSVGMVDNTRRFEQYSQNGNPAIAEIAALPAVRRKLALNVMDALTAGYAGGPAFRPQYSWQPNTLYFSLDPVALDAVCLQLLETKRKEANVSPLGERAAHVATAAQLGLGRNNTNQIEVVEVTP
jgi:uncharacterized protein (DUF362 family)